MEYMLVRWGYWPGLGQHFVVLYRYPAWLPVLEHSRKIRHDVVRTHIAGALFINIGVEIVDKLHGFLQIVMYYKIPLSGLL